MNLTRPSSCLVAVLLGGMVLTSCGPRLDHLGREPSFTELERVPKAIPRNPSIQQQKPAPFVDRSYGDSAQPGGQQTAPLQSASIKSSDMAYMASQRNAMMSRNPGLHGSTGSLWSSDPRSLFGDRRARMIGDILTVLIEIDDQANISNETSRQRAGDENMTATALLGLESIVNKVLPGQGLNPGVATNSTSTASGQGQVSRNEAISLKVAARVLDVLPSGHLLITGRQEVRVNFELRDLQVMGLIRPEDITRNNQITYDKMAEARISYGGRGHISDMQQARYGQQVLDMIAPF